MSLFIAALSIALGLTACTTPTTQWVQSNQSDPAAQTVAQCRYEARAMAGSPTVIPSKVFDPVSLGLIANQSRTRGLFRDCMAARGYVRQ